MHGYDKVILQDHFAKIKMITSSSFLFPTSKLLYEAGPELLTKIKKLILLKITQIYSNLLKIVLFREFFFFALFLGF